MKKYFLLFVSTLFILSASAQIENPVTWSYTVKRIDSKTYEVHLTATLDNKWHIYAQEAGEGPEPTTITFSKNPLVKLDGKVKEDGKLQKEYDKNFGSELKYYNNKVDFVQKVKLKSAASTTVKGTISYMVCNDRKCLPPKEIPFVVKITGK